MAELEPKNEKQIKEIVEAIPDSAEFLIEVGADSIETIVDFCISAIEFLGGLFS